MATPSRLHLLTHCHCAAAGNAQSLWRRIAQNFASSQLPNLLDCANGRRMAPWALERRGLAEPPEPPAAPDLALPNQLGELKWSHLPGVDASFLELAASESRSLPRPWLDHHAMGDRLSLQPQRHGGPARLLAAANPLARARDRHGQGLVPCCGMQA